MITRIWHGKTKPEDENTYLNFLLKTGTDEYRQTPGNLSAKVWKMSDRHESHFWTVTEWENLESVKAFAGEDYQNAKYYPEDDGILLEFEEHVNHYDVHDVSNAKLKNYIRQLEQLYHGGNWLAESFEGKLNELTEQVAFAVPVPGVHSVAEIVWHCIYWRTVLIKRLEGDNDYRNETLEKLNFLSLGELKKKGWPDLLHQLEKTQSAIEELLRDQTDNFLEQEYEPGHTFDFIVEGTIQHDSYHLGQIGLVLKILKVGSMTGRG